MLLSFYQSLPSIEAVSNFYIKGYTESLKLFSGVKVVPHSDFIESSDAKQFSKLFFAIRQLPCYFVPIFVGRSCYGFVLRSAAEKFTPRFNTSLNRYVPGCEGIQAGDTVFMCEGFKDCGPLRLLGLKAIPFLTAVPTLELLKWLKTLNCKVVIIPDNDTHRDTHVQQIAKRFKDSGFVNKQDWFWYPLSGVKDTGEFFDSREKAHEVVFHLKKIVKLTRRLGWNT
jgi:hypothetical protein